MVLIKKKYSLLFLLLFINQFKFFNSFGVGGIDSGEPSSIPNTFEPISDIIWEIEEKYEEEENEEKNENKEVGKEENEEEEEENEKNEGENQQKSEENKNQTISEIDSTEEISPFDKYDNCENIQPTYGIKEDCINYKIFNEQSCCYMTINYKYNDFNLCIRISKDKDEIKKKIKQIQEEYEGCESVSIDCHSNFIKLAKYFILFLFVL